MAETSKELLDQPSKPSLLETLLLGSKDPLPRNPPCEAGADGDARGRPLTTAVPRSQVLGKVKDFLGVMAQVNEELQLDARRNSRADYNIEVLRDSEQEYIEMDLLLGVTDLHTAEAVAAAEATMGSIRPAMNSISSGSSDTEGDSDANSGSDGEIDTCSLDNKLHTENDESRHKNKPNKRPKIVVLN